MTNPALVIPAKAGIHTPLTPLPIDRLKQVPPLRIVAFNQLNFPSPPPFLHGLLSGDGFCNVGECLDVNEHLHGIAFGETVGGSVPMFPDAPSKVVGNANIQRAVFF
jgi:hypothetical protein